MVCSVKPFPNLLMEDKKEQRENIFNRSSSIRRLRSEQLKFKAHQSIKREKNLNNPRVISERTNKHLRTS